MLRAILTAGAVLAALLAPASAHARETGQGVPPLTDRHGRVLTLRGWNIEDKTHRGDEALSGITERHLRDLRAQGFGFARLLVFWDDLEPRPGQYSRGYLRKIERVLDWAHRHDVQVVIDAHQDVFGPAFGHRGIPEWATRTDGLPFTPHPDDWFAEYFEPAVQRAFTHLYEDADLRRAQSAMWRTLAARFARHPAVFGYDLINEPMGEQRPGEDLPSAARRIERDQLTPMYNRLADAVRSADRGRLGVRRADADRGRGRTDRARPRRRSPGRVRAALLQHRHGGGRRLRSRVRLDRGVRNGPSPRTRSGTGSRWWSASGVR